jgi:acyl-homoserine lactone acylase PvdQ
LELRRQEKAREDDEKANRLQLEIQLENTHQTTQQQMFKMQSDASAVMQQILTSVMLQKAPLDKYRDRKASIAAMLAAGDITANVAKQLMTKLASELLDSSLI